MKITHFNPEPIRDFPFLNAGRRPNQFYQDTLLVYHGVVDGLPDTIDCIVATADLQGREVLPRKPTSPPRLLGEALPEMLADTLKSLGVVAMDRVLTLLAGDFFTYEDLRGRGGSGDVTSVWMAMANAYGWVAGVAGNHDMFGSERSRPPRFDPPVFFLDGEQTEIEGLSIAGVSGILGNPEKNFRRAPDGFLESVDYLLRNRADIVLMHDGPDAPQMPQARGHSEIRSVLERSRPVLVVRGHAHWPEPLTELSNGTQVLNVDCTVAILTRPSPAVKAERSH